MNVNNVMTLRSQILYMYVIIHGNSAVQMSFKLTVVHIGHQNKHRTALVHPLLWRIVIIVTMQQDSLKLVIK